MSWTEQMPEWLRALFVPAETADDESVDEELMFHLRALVDDNIAQGLSHDDAWQRAQQRFGSLRRYAAQCRNVAHPGRLVMRAGAAGGLLVLAVAAGGLLLEVRALRRENAALAKVHNEISAIEARLATMAVGRNAGPINVAHSAAVSRAETAEFGDLTGCVLDNAGQPVANANVLVILKTWPGGRYRQDDFALLTDTDGRFRLEKQVPAKGQFAVHAAVVKNGYAMASSYHVTPDGADRPEAPLEMHLAEAPPITLVVRDALGQPVPQARAVPASRRSPDGQQHSVYFQASRPIQQAADDAGRIGLGCFERGDQAEIYIQLPGQDWQRRAVAIPLEGDEIIMPVAPPNDAVPKSNSA